MGWPSLRVQPRARSRLRSEPMSLTTVVTARGWHDGEHLHGDGNACCVVEFRPVRPGLELQAHCLRRSHPAQPATRLSVPNATTSLTVTPDVSDTTATVTVNGVAVASGAASGSIALAVGPNVLTTVVTAEDGTTNTYTVTVTRAAVDECRPVRPRRSAAGTLSPAFATGTTAYTASVPNATASLTLTPTASDATASITVNGVTVVSGAASGSDHACGRHQTSLTTVVTAQDGTTQTILHADGHSCGLDERRVVRARA